MATDGFFFTCGLKRRKFAGELGNPLLGCFLSVELAAFRLLDFLAIVFDMADLLNHAQTEYILGFLELDSNFIAGPYLFTPDDVANQVVILVQNGDTDPHPFQQFDRFLRNERETAEADIGYGLVYGLVVFIFRKVQRYLYRYTRRVADKFSNRCVIWQWLPTFC